MHWIARAMFSSREQINKRHITAFAVSTGALALLLLGGLYLSTLYLPYGVCTAAQPTF